MDGKGRAIDNSFIERLWRTVKQDCVYLYAASNGKELDHGLKGGFTYYNIRKSHQGIGRQIPAQRPQPTAGCTKPYGIIDTLVGGLGPQKPE